MRAGSQVFTLLMLFLCNLCIILESGKTKSLFGKLCPVVFLVICICSSVFLQSIFMSYVDCGGDG